MKLYRNANHGDRVSFNVYPTAVLGQNFEEVKLVGIVPAQVAQSLGHNPYIMHQQVFPLLPVGSTANDADSYPYLLIQSANGTIQAVGEAWIDLSTFKVITRKRAVIYLEEVDQDKLQIAKEALAANGILVSSAELV